VNTSDGPRNIVLDGGSDPPTAKGAVDSMQPLPNYFGLWFRIAYNFSHLSCTTAGSLLTWSELNNKLQSAEEEKASVAEEAARTSELLKLKLAQSKDTERRLRSDIRSAELDSLRKQHAALQTS